MKKCLIILVACFFVLNGYAQKNDPSEAYIEKYKALAIDEMEIFGIPASITMAQGLLESDCGRSRLAVQANNHFGIKCKKEWTGETITHDDDAKGECFRKYKSAHESYKDHSEFLDKSPRYASLFDLDPKDYVGWANGLKAAGYATNPKYADILVGIIEKYQLYKLDEGIDAYAAARASTKEKAEVAAKEEVAKAVAVEPRDLVDIDNYVVNIYDDGATTKGKRVVQHNNGVNYVIAAEGDTFQTLSEDLGISVKKLLKFNDLYSVIDLKPGVAVYIKDKKKKSISGRDIYTAKAGDKMHALSQKFGIKLDALYKLNMMKGDAQPTEGMILRLK